MQTIIELNNNKIQNSINSFVEEGENTVEKGNLFSKWVLKYLFEQPDDEIDGFIAIDGKNDNSIDAFFEEGKTLYLIQCKYNTSHSWAGISKFILDLQRLITNPESIIGNNPLVYEVSDKIREYEDKDQNIEAYYITNAEFTTEDSEKIKSESNSFNEENEKFNLHFLDIDGIKDYIDMELDVIPKKYQGKTASLILKNFFISNITCIAEIELKDFATFVKSNKEYLFYSNIRNYLRNTPVNKGIVDTFRSKPTDIWYYNNGVTMVCDEFELRNERFLYVNTPQIVNGCQTANTILNEYINLGKEDKTKQLNLQGTILVKIIKDKNKKKKDQITRFTNKQNSVSGKDFFALDSFQRQLVKDFENLGYLYEIQNKSSLTKTKKDLLSYKGIDTYKYLFGKKFDNVLPVKTVVQTFAAGMHFLPGTAASRSGELMVYGKKWSTIFNDSTPENPLYWLYPFIIMYYAKNQLDYNNKSEVYHKRISLMFFVSCYFRTLCHLFNV